MVELNTLNGWKLAKWLSVRLRTKWVWVQIPLLSLNLFDTLAILLEAGVQSKNNLWFIYVNSIYSELCKTLCKALPAYHPLTRCDYIASFFIKGKLRSIKFLVNNCESLVKPISEILNETLTEISSLRGWRSQWNLISETLLWTLVNY